MTVANITISSHPVVMQQIELLRDRTLSPSAVRASIDEIARCLAYETTRDLSPSKSVSIVPVLRSGMSMMSAYSTVLPDVPIFHIGIFREKASLQPIEYYNKLPKQCTDVAIVLDPVVATGGTANAVIATLKEWGAKEIIFVSVLAGTQGLKRFENMPGVHFVVGAVDAKLDASGYLVPGIGDIGDRLYGVSA
ncbi:uracil phosphoribosyltransferase [Schizosaccharomyces japonicus yFS275]|uniref:uracil phosphoribosyltransferase n=1 Tax=Schizosaccharomyces japonicus (strain yFS275 / FY16936) TaxID=402676 RepID=B6K7J5_SCHJY|nr:uracil phosphoribosyltransferase [Schizosaccharomyces japonicus yFS275]EEB09499.1 uracil phosphoribosyltransferase [Schizosaccharomyces japonicus yFS275]